MQVLAPHLTTAEFLCDKARTNSRLYVSYDDNDRMFALNNVCSMCACVHVCVVCVHVCTCEELPQGIHPSRDLAKKKLPEKKTQVCLKNADMARLRCLAKPVVQETMGCPPLWLHRK